MPPLDLRHLPPPEPMQRILEALETMPPHTRLDALTPQRPEPLLPLLAQWGYAWRIQALEGGSAHITICRREDVDALLGAQPAA